MIPGGLPPADAAEALRLLQHVRDTAVRIDAEIQSAGSLPPSISNRGFPAQAQARILLEGLQRLEGQGSILTSELISRWIEETNARLHAIGVREPIDAPPAPPALRPIRTVRPFPLRRPSFDPSNDAEIHDYLKKLVKLDEEKIGVIWGTITFGADRIKLAGTLSQILHGRGLNDEQSRDLGLGLYPKPSKLRTMLRAAGYGQSVDEGVWDKLQGYITFPWRDGFGHGMTLYGRWPSKDANPSGLAKTLALPGEGSKRSPLYCDRARADHHDHIVMVEGLLDAALAQSRGLTDVVAYVGGAPAVAQLHTLARNRVKAITICPDPDAGGNSGILSFLKNVDPAIRAYVAPDLPTGVDPDEFMLAEGIEAWRQHLSRAVRGAVYRTTEILKGHDVGTASGRDDALDELVEYATTASPRDLDDIIRHAADQLGMSASTLAEMFVAARQELANQPGRRRNGQTSDAGKDGSGDATSTAPSTPFESLSALLAMLGDRTEVPEIDAGVLDLRIIMRQAWDAIVLANAQQPFIFKHGGVPVWISRDDEGRATLNELTQTHIRHILARVAELYIIKVKKMVQDDGSELPMKIRYVVLPPNHVCADILATPDPDLPVVSRLTESPVFAPDGTLQTTPGYRAASRTYLAIPSGLTIPTVADEPSPADISRARSLILDDLIGDFPCADAKIGAERANAIALGLEPFVRAMIDGPLPLHSFEAPTPGSGKGLLADTLLWPSCGRTVGAISQAKDEDEWRKRVTAALVQGYPAIQIDNANRPIESGALSMALTIPIWTDHILGLTRMVSAPVRCSWVVTANNPTYSTEMARRTVRTRIDPKVDRPQDREGWRHPELPSRADDNRGELIWAFCTLVRAWVSAGRPKFSGRALGSFERWSHVVGGILENADITGFLANQATFYEVADAETAVWRAFVATWWEKFQDREVGTADLFPLALETDDLDLGSGESRSQKTRFGKLLGAQRDRVIGDYRVVAGRKSHKAQRWRLQAGNMGNVDERFDTLLHAHVRADSRTPGAEMFPNVPHVPPSDDTPMCVRGCGAPCGPGDALLCVEHRRAASTPPFAPSTDWQEVPDGFPCPPGGEYRMDFETGKNWARCSLFGQRAESLSQYIQRGTKLYVDGRLEARPRIDRSSEPRAGLELVVDTVELAGSRQDNGGHNQPQAQQGRHPSATGARGAAHYATGRNDSDLEDLPF